LAARPVGAHNRSLTPFAAQNGFDDGGLADAGIAGHDQHFEYQCEPDCAYLAFGKGKLDGNPRPLAMLKPDHEQDYCDPKTLLVALKAGAAAN